MTQPIPVIFRAWRTGEVIALFPTIDEGDGCCLSYEHIGQHGGADYHGCILATRPATPSEYAELKQELERIRYTLDIRTRKPIHA